MKERNKFSRYILILFIVGALLGFGLQMTVAAKDSVVQMIPEDFSDLAEKARPGVVNIRTVKKIEGGGPVFRHFFGNPFGHGNPFEDFFTPSPRGGSEGDFKQQSLGSGFIIDPEGYIVTNNHVIDNADEIKVKLSNGKAFDAEVVGRDAKTDLALIKIHRSNGLKPLPLGDSNALRVGTWV
ncbi:MAG: trypsin-like peptidase domain-containing protein, partial [Desulfobacteraceae bacterium]